MGRNAADVAPRTSNANLWPKRDEPHAQRPPGGVDRRGRPPALPITPRRKCRFLARAERLGLGHVLIGLLPVGTIASPCFASVAPLNCFPASARTLGYSASGPVVKAFSKRAIRCSWAEMRRSLAKLDLGDPALTPRE